MKLFSLTSNTMTKHGRKFSQIQAEVDSKDVRKGDLGGWVEDELSLGDGVWIHEDVLVFAATRIQGGEIYGGEIRGGEIRGGVIYGGVIRGGVIRGGEIYGGEIRGGVIRGGVIRGGVIHGGEIHGDNHMGFANVGSENGYLFAYVIDDTIMISRGCFHGTIDEFYQKVDDHHGVNEHAQFYNALRPIIEMKLNEHLELKS